MVCSRAGATTPSPSRPGRTRSFSTRWSDYTQALVRILSPARPQRIDTLCGVTGAAFGEQAVWNYIVPAPKMQVVVLDTRTRRKFTGEGYLPPDLVGLNRDAQLPAGPFTDGRELIFVVSAAPVLGPDIIDSLGWPVAQIAIDVVHHGKGLDGSGTQQANIGVEKYDAEGWSSNDLAREDLLKRLATYPRVVLLGGDVHFADSVTLDYYKKGVTAPSRIVQLTSSPARNQFKAVVKLLLRQNAMLQRVETEYTASRLAWTSESSLVVPTGQIRVAWPSLSHETLTGSAPSRRLAGRNGIPNGQTTRLALAPNGAARSATRDGLAHGAASGAALGIPGAEGIRRAARLPQRRRASSDRCRDTLRFSAADDLQVATSGIVRLSKDASNNIILRHTLISEEQAEFGDRRRRNRARDSARAEPEAAA